MTSHVLMIMVLVVLLGPGWLFWRILPDAHQTRTSSCPHILPIGVSNTMGPAELWRLDRNGKTCCSKCELRDPDVGFKHFDNKHEECVFQTLPGLEFSFKMKLQFALERRTNDKLVMLVSVNDSPNLAMQLPHSCEAQLMWGGYI